MASPHPPPPLEAPQSVEDSLSYLIHLCERIRNAVPEAVFFKHECSEVGRLADRLSQMLRSAARAATSGQAYDRPLRRISADASRRLQRALSLLRRCRRRGFLHRLVNLVSSADFRRSLSLLDASVADMRWLLSILDTSAVADGGGDGGGGGGGIILSLPPIASNDPILAWVWSFVAAAQMAELSSKIEAANELASLANDNDRNKKVIVEEGGIPPLLKLLKESSSPEAQIAAANALYNLSNDEVRVRTIVDHLGVPAIVQVLADSPMRVQIRVSDLIARMAEFDDIAKEEFDRENVIRPLVSLLSFETFDDDFDPRKFGTSNNNNNTNSYYNNKQSIHAIVQINKEKQKKEKPRLLGSYSSFSSMHSEGGSGRRGGQTRKERENEAPEVKREMKVSSARALWMLAKGSLSNSRSITETKGLLCLAKLIEKERGELRRNCVMAVMEITSAAELDADLRRSAFKTNSPAAKAVIEQLLGVIREPGDPSLQAPAVKSIGCLSRTFPARESRVIGPLVGQLVSTSHEVSNEAAIALGKFASPENFLCQEHSRAIIESGGVLAVIRSLRASERVLVHGLILLCYLTIHGSDNENFERARVLSTLEGVDRSICMQHPELRELIPKALYRLNLYQADDIRPLRQGSLRR